MLERGIKVLIDKQLPNGDWPQVHNVDVTKTKTHQNSVWGLPTVFPLKSASPMH